MTPSEKPLSWNATLVLQAMERGFRYGFEIMNAASLPSGTVYPILRRMETAGYVESSWENEDVAHSDGRPARRYYLITDPGRRVLQAALKRIAVQQRLFGDIAPVKGSGH